VGARSRPERLHRSRLGAIGQRDQRFPSPPRLRPAGTIESCTHAAAGSSLSPGRSGSSTAKFAIGAIRCAAYRPQAIKTEVFFNMLHPQGNFYPQGAFGPQAFQSNPQGNFYPQATFGPQAFLSKPGLHSFREHAVRLSSADTRLRSRSAAMAELATSRATTGRATTGGSAAAGDPATSGAPAGGATARGTAALGHESFHGCYRTERRKPIGAWTQQQPNPEQINPAMTPRHHLLPATRPIPLLGRTAACAVGGGNRLSKVPSIPTLANSRAPANSYQVRWDRTSCPVSRCIDLRWLMPRKDDASDRERKVIPQPRQETCHG